MQNEAQYDLTGAYVGLKATTVEEAKFEYSP